MNRKTKMYLMAFINVIPVLAIPVIMILIKHYTFSLEDVPHMSISPIITVLTLTVISLFTLVKFKTPDKEQQLKNTAFIRKISIIAGFLMIAEVFLFNSTSFSSELRSDEISLETISLNNDEAVYEDDTIKVMKDTNLVIGDIPSDTRTLLVYTSAEDEDTSCKIEVSIKDSNFSEEFQIVGMKYKSVFGKPCEFRINPYKGVKSVRVRICDKNRDITLTKITACTASPFEFSNIRFFVLLFSISIVIIIFRYEIWKKYYDDTNKRHKIIILVYIILCTLTSILFYKPDIEPVEYEKGQDTTYSDQFIKTFDSIYNGRVYITDEHDEKLDEIENPYDTSLRNKFEVKSLWANELFA